MNVDREILEYEAAGALAEELPYWGWLEDGRSCLTRSGELVSIGRLSPVVLDGRTPDQLDRVLERWQRMLSGIDSRTRLYFYLFRRPTRFEDADEHQGVSALSRRKRRAFLARRVQDVEIYLAWSYDPRLATVSKGRGGKPWWMSHANNWLARRRNPHESVYLYSDIRAAAERFRRLVDSSRALVTDLTPIQLLDAHAGSLVLSELINRPGTPWDGATGSGMNWRLAVSELEAERRHLRLDGEPVILYSLLSPPGAASANLLSDLYCLDARMTIAIEWRPWGLDSARRKIRSAQRHYFSKRYSMAAHMQETEGTSAAAAACLAPIFGPPRGSPRSRHLDRDSLAVLETRWKTPYYYDLFHGDVGHTLVLGATGAGKSFTLNFLLVEALQYDPRVLILDLGGSYRWLTSFLGGGYLELSPESNAAGSGFRLRPFSLPAGERTYQFLTGWLTRLLRIGGWQAGGEDPSEIRARVEDLYAFPPGRRTLGVLVRSLPSKMWSALDRWHGEGAWGRYFDNPASEDDLELEGWQVIDLAGAAEHEDLCEAALFYLLERMRLALEDPAETARVKLMVVDEAWRYLRDPAVLSYLAEAAKTWRKKNAALIVATQSAVDVTGTAGAEALLESMPTKLFLANPELPGKAAETFRLNPSEVNTIRGLMPKRELYLRRPEAAGVLRLEVDPESYWLYTSSPLDAQKRAEAVERYGLEGALEQLGLNGGKA